MLRFMLCSAVLLFSTLVQATGRVADVQIYDRTDRRVLPIHYHEGRYYVVGRPGNEYQITIRSQSGQRVLAVTSVDGINVITGDSASPEQSGYVLDGYSSTEIKGWRKNLQRTAAFYFTEHSNSYAARTGRPHDVGVIGVALFRERQPLPRREQSIGQDKRRAEESSAAQAPGAYRGQDESLGAQPSAKAEPKLGTGHGRSESSWARYTQFERASHSPDEVITIYYDSYANLLAQGVVRDYAYNYAPHRPRPFPNGRFVPDP